MFNSPLLDVTIGLVFIFLLYSLLATSINESIASLFSLRARMLKNAIVVGMLSDTSKDGRWASIVKGFLRTLDEIVRMLLGKSFIKTDTNSIGHKFFDHPIIKNYGSGRIFSKPSYIPTKNFSAVLIDQLKNVFNAKVDDIALSKFKNPDNISKLATIRQDLMSSSDVAKLMELFNYYDTIYATGIIPAKKPEIDLETLQILQMHLRDSCYNLETFTGKIENWYDDSMVRVGGWYKRQAAIITFFIGIILAVIFNVDIIRIAGTLSKDKDARDKLVQLSIQAVDKYKDDPRVKKVETKNGTLVPDTASAANSHNDSIFKQYQAKFDSVRNLLRGEIASTNEILAIGWGDYGKQKNGKAVLIENGKLDSCCPVIPRLSKSDSIKCAQKILDRLYDEHWIKYKVGYVIRESARGKKFLGFLIFAFAISLGAPFWFDLLNKLVNMRNAGKKETGGTTAPTPSTPAPASAPVSVTVNTQKPGEEAAG